MSETTGIVFPSLSAEGFTRIVPEPRPGSERYLYATNLCDPCSWFHGATLRSNIELTDSGDLTTWTSGEANWIDVKHGRIFKEDNLLAADATLAVVVEVSEDDGATWEPQTENTWGTTDGDFTVNYAVGSVTFNTALAGGSRVRASFKKSAGYSSVLAPDPGKRLKLMYVEVQFTKDIVMTGPVQFQIWAYNPADPTWDPENGVLPKAQLVAETYKRVWDFFQESTGPFPVIPAFGGGGSPDRGVGSDLITLPFNYLAFRDLRSSQGAEIRVALPAGVPFGGQFASVTFYCLQEAEE